MELGFIPAATAGGFFVTVWHPGDATIEKKSWAERLASPAGVRYGGWEVLGIDAWRCTGCGRIQLFAIRPPERGESLWPVARARDAASGPACLSRPRAAF
jgi:hypothetical protein